MEERREAIKRYLTEKGQVTYKELERFFPEISVMTLRRDLIQLETEGSVVRTRGGAVARSTLAVSAETSISHRAAENMEGKKQIAQKAVGLIRPGRAIYMDSGTTMLALAHILPDDNLYIITAGPNIAMEAMRYGNPTVLMIGGNLNRNNISVSGVHSLEMIRSINIDLAFLVASGYDAENGFTCGTFSECELKRAIMEKARRRVLMMDSTKLGRSMPFTFAAMGEIDVLITDAQPGREMMEQAYKYGVEVL